MVAGGADFQTDVAPLLEARCLACRGPKRQRAGLRLDTSESAFRVIRLGASDLSAGG